MLNKNDDGVSLRIISLLGIITVVAILCFASIYALKINNKYVESTKIAEEAANVESQQGAENKGSETTKNDGAEAIAENENAETESKTEGSEATENEDTETTAEKTEDGSNNNSEEILTVADVNSGNTTSRSKIEGMQNNATESDADTGTSAETNDGADDNTNTETATEIDSDENATNYVSISEVKISKNMDLTQLTGLSKEDFVQLMAECKYDTTGWFETNAAYIYDLCQEYQLNEIFFCGLISAESGWSIASAHRNAHNYISLMSNGHLIKYSSLEEGLRVAAQKLHNNYLSEGGCFYYGKTLSAVNTKFCGSSTWVNLVYGRMQQIL